MISRRGRTAGALLALLVPTALLGQNAKVRVVLRPQVVGVGEPAELKFELEATTRAPGFQPRFELHNLSIVGGPVNQQSMSITNGELSRSVSLVWYLSPIEPGPARVHSITVEATEAPQQRRRQRRPDPFRGLFRDLFSPRQNVPIEKADIRLEAEVSPHDPYPGQQHTYTLYLLEERRRPGTGRVQVSTILPRIGSFRGFWTREIDLPEEIRPEVVERDGRPYWRRPVLRRALFAFQPGKQELPASEAELHVIYYRPSGFGEEPTRPESVAVESNPVTVTVRDLPPSAGNGFKGAVGRFRIESGLEPTEIEAGQSAQLTIRIVGDGNLDGLPDPVMPTFDGISVFPPEETSSWRARGSRVEGERSWLYTLVPERAGTWNLPSVDWIIFDPVAQSYETISTTSATLVATGDPEPAVAETELPERVEDAPPTPAGLGASTVGATRALGSTPALAAAALGGAFLTLVLVWGASRRKRPDQALVDRLEEAFREEKPRRCAAAAEEAWRAFVDHRWGVQPGTPSTEWGDRLTARGADQAAAADLGRLMDDLHYLRYAPKLAEIDGLRADLSKRAQRLARVLS